MPFRTKQLIINDLLHELNLWSSKWNQHFWGNFSRIIR